MDQQDDYKFRAALVINGHFCSHPTLPGLFQKACKQTWGTRYASISSQIERRYWQQTARYKIRFPHPDMSGIMAVLLTPTILPDLAPVYGLGFFLCICFFCCCCTSSLDLRVAPPFPGIFAGSNCHSSLAVVRLRRRQDVFVSTYWLRLSFQCWPR